MTGAYHYTCNSNEYHYNSNDNDSTTAKYSAPAGEKIGDPIFGDDDSFLQEHSSYKADSTSTT